MGLSHQLAKRKLKAFPYKTKTNSGYKVSKYSKKHTTNYKYFTKLNAEN